MNELIKINYDETNDKASVSGRELHEALGIETPYHKWFTRMCEYGFAEGEDFNSDKNVRVQKEGNRDVAREVIDHQLTIPMAKELCMLQRNDKGKLFRQYFIKVEEQWNTPEAVMARALKFADRKILSLEGTIEQQKETINVLTNENKLLSSETLEWADRKLINAIVRRYAGGACDGDFKLAWTRFKKELLYKHEINLNSRITKHLNETGKKTPPKTLDMLSDIEVPDALRTAVSLCREGNVNISDLLNKTNTDV